MDQVRLDRWLWAVRLAPTRTAATDACRAGHVRVNGRRAKPAAPVRVGDRVAAKVGRRPREVEVVELLERRVGAALAVTAYVDHTPSPPPTEAPAAVPVRDRGTGRPTKRDRRRLDRARGH